MQFKRRCLVPGRTLVNAAFAVGLFLLAGCGEKPNESAANTSPMPSETQPNSDGDAFPAVWSTARLSGAVSDVALAGGAASTLAIGYTGGGLQFFDLEGDQMTDVADLQVLALSEGAFVQVLDTDFIVFPGLDAQSELTAYVYASGMDVPQEVVLPIPGGEQVAGLCSQRRGRNVDGLLDITFWSLDMPSQAISGYLSVDGSDFAWTETTRTQRPNGSLCAYVDEEPTFHGAGLRDVSALSRPNDTYLVTLDAVGRVYANAVEDAPREFQIRDGLSVRVPQPPIAMAGLGTPFGGGYPNGLIVVAGDTGSGSQVVFVDAGPLTTASTTAAP